METQPREPDTRANVAAWVTYAASLSESEQWEHTDECPISLAAILIKPTVASLLIARCVTLSSN